MLKSTLYYFFLLVLCLNTVDLCMWTVFSWSFCYYLTVGDHFNEELEKIQFLEFFVIQWEWRISSVMVTYYK